MKNWEALLARSPKTCLYGGTASGKTFCALTWCITVALLAADAGLAFSACVCRRTYPELTKACWEVAIKILDEWGVIRVGGVKIRKSPAFQLIFANNVKIEFKHADRASEIKGMEYDIWLLDEANDIPREFYKETLIRIPRGDHRRFLDTPQIILTWNPVSKSSWVYEEFFTHEQPPDVKIVQSTYLDNPHVSERALTQLMEWKASDPRRWEVYGLGNWGAPDELIYPRWRIAHDDEIPRAGRRYDAVGIDWGYANPTAVIGLFIDSDCVVADELLYRSEIPISDLCLWASKRPELYDVPVFCDPSAPASIADMQRVGIAAEPADNTVAAGISWLQGRDILVTPRSEGLRREIAGYCWQKNLDGQLTDKPVKIMDHACDAMRYAAYTWHVKGYDVPVTRFSGFFG